MKQKRFNRAEKYLLADTDPEKFNTYRCEEHGVYQLRKDVDDGLCIFCKSKNEPLQNLEELKVKFQKELRR